MDKELIMPMENGDLHKFERPGELKKRVITFLVFAVPLVVFLKLFLG
jgi:hypothetical protein